MKTPAFYFLLLVMLLPAAVRAEGCPTVPTEIDNHDWSAVSWDVANGSCRIRGSCWHLPSPEELINFIGLPGSTGNLLWTAEYIFLETAGGPKVMRLNDGASSYSSSIYPGSPAGAYAFRCVR